MKTCTKCGELKPLNEYYRSIRKDRKLQEESHCKSCCSIRKKKYRLENKDKIRADNKKRNPGWDIERYNQYVELQGNRCAICGTDNPGLSDWCADHCHTENKARGLLCVQCNAGLGYSVPQDSAVPLVVKYLPELPVCEGSAY
jgi:hypothetical protein